MEVSAQRSHQKKKPDPSGPTRQKPEQGEVKGLCVNCSNRNSCTLPGLGMESLMHCEEFYCETGECAPSTHAQKQLVKEPAVTEPQGLKGLCVNCDERFDCKFKKAPGGVWHCTEYH